MNSMVFAILTGRIQRLWMAVALALALAALAACGGASEPPTAAPEPTAPQATAAPATQSEGQSTSTEAAAPSAKLAPAFELPNAAGETVSLASYAGDRNVVLVFYRGFW